MATAVVGARIKARREELGFNQDALAKALGFKDRQTVSAIETGNRRVSAEELVLVSDVLDAPLEFFTDPFLLVGEGAFSWRQRGVAPADLATYERTAGRLIALFRVLRRRIHCDPPLLRPSLTLSEKSSFEEAAAAGERFAAEFALGEIPGTRLAEVMERELGILVLMVDTIDGISGAACHLPELDAVLINRREVRGRRNYDLAHELFHILTWEAMPPERVEDNRRSGRGNRVEQLAENFASAVLMPTSVLARFGDWMVYTPRELPGRLNVAAEELGVSSSALRYRLLNAGLLPPDVAKSVEERRLRNNGRPSADQELPPLFSRTFAAVVAEAIDAGEISVRRVAGILGLDVDDLAEMFAAHGMDFDTGI